MFGVYRELIAYKSSDDASSNVDRK